MHLTRACVTLRTIDICPIRALTRFSAALARVLDPEIRRPITELGMVESVRHRPGRSRCACGVLLTVAGCPMREQLTRDVTAAVSRSRVSPPSTSSSAS